MVEPNPQSVVVLGAIYIGYSLLDNRRPQPQPASKVSEDDPVAMVVKRSLSNTPNKARLGIVKEK